MHANSLVFTSLPTVSQAGDKLNQDLSNDITKGFDADVYPAGLRKQYEIQLRWLKERVASLEIVFAPGPIAPPGEFALCGASFHL